MEGTSSFDSSFDNCLSENGGVGDVPAAPSSSSSSTPTLLNNLQAYSYHPPKRQFFDASNSAEPPLATQTAVFLNDVRKRWEQRIPESEPPAKMSRAADNLNDSSTNETTLPTVIPETPPFSTNDEKSKTDSDDHENTANVASRSEARTVGPPIAIEKRDRKTASNRGRIRSGSSSDSEDDKKKIRKSDADSNYEPSSAPSTDTEEFEEDEVSEASSDDDGDGDDEYKPPKPKNASQRKRIPAITALTFLKNNSIENDSGSDDDNSKSCDKGKNLFGAKSSFQMLRKLRAMKASKREQEFDGQKSSSSTKIRKSDDNDDVSGNEKNSKNDDSEAGPVPAVSTKRRSSADEFNVDRNLTERFGMSRKRQVLLSEDEDENSNMSSSCAAQSTVSAAVGKNSEPDSNSTDSFRRATKGTKLRKTVVFSSSDDENDAIISDGESSKSSNQQSLSTPEEMIVQPPAKLSRSEIREKCVQIFNDAPIDQLAAIQRSSQRIAEALIACRPFESFEDLVAKMENIKIKGSSVQMIHAYVEVLELQNGLDRLLHACQQIADHLETAVDDLLEGRGQTVSQPASLNNEQYSLKPYQIVGLNWLILMYRNKLNAILADEMGLGKTIQVIAFMAYLKEQRIAGPHVIVVPSSTMDNWLNEFRRWCPDLRVLTYYGSMDDRRFLRKEVQLGRQSDFDVLLSTYRVITSSADDRAFFKKLNICYAVFDEAHMLKSAHTARYKSLMKVRAKHRLLLTGTPLQNNLVELVSLLHFLMPNLFRNYTENLKDILTLFQAKNGCLGEYEQEKIEQAKRIMKPFVLRRLKADVLSQLPEKHEKIETCELTKTQSDVYGSMITEYSVTVSKDDAPSNLTSQTDCKSMFMQLRKVANHQLLVRRLYTDEKLQEMAKILKKEKTHRNSEKQHIFEDMSVMNDFQLHLMCRQYKCLNRFKLQSNDIEDSGKLKALDKILPDIKAQGNKVLMFSQFTMVLDVLEEYLRMRKMKYLRLDGQTPVVERQIMIDRFNNTPALFAFLLSTRAGGLGINLTSANTIILHDIDYNPYNDKQAEDRCHRVGQTKEVTVIRLIAKNTVDETMLACAHKKLLLEQQVTGSDHQEDEEDPRDVESLLKQALNL